MNKRILVLLSTLITLTGCKNSQGDYRVIIDMEGTEVKVPIDVKSVACISQSATDFMISFGLANKIKGTYRSFTYNPWTIEICPQAANFKSYSYSVSAEELLSDGVDLVILQDTENAAAFRNAGLPVVAVHQYSPDGPFDDEVYDTARIIGEIFPEAKDKADAWILDVKNTINEIKNAIGSTRQEEKNVYYVNGEKKKGLFYSDGGNSMISRTYDVANVILATEKYHVLNVHNVSDEEIFNIKPYAMMIGGAYQNRLDKELHDTSTWKTLECVGAGRVYRIPVCMIGIDNLGCETPLMLKYTASLFNDGYNIDLENEIITTMKKYFNFDMTREQAGYMSQGLDKNGEDMIHD